ncbi:MAG TPA: CsbD family protein [Actinophytocola sp.]|nr:CsbD family protein [Actinophytocola sp.]
MSDKNEGVRGAVEEIKGRFKEAAGAMVGDDATTREGQAQQDKAESQREVAEKEAEADRARAEAAQHETRERSQQDR